MKIINYLLISSISLSFLGCSFGTKPEPKIYKKNEIMKDSDDIKNIDTSSKKTSNEVIYSSKKTNSLLICNPETTILNNSIIIKSNKEIGDLIKSETIVNNDSLPEFGYMIFINGKYFNQLGAFQYDIKNFKEGSLNKIEIYKTYFVSGDLLNNNLKYSNKFLYHFMNQEEFQNSYISNVSGTELYHFKKKNKFDFYYTKIIKDKEYKENKNYLIAEKIIDKTFTMIDDKKYSVLLKEVTKNKVKYNLKFINQSTFNGKDYYLNNYSFDCNLIKYKKTLSNSLL